MTVVIGLLAGSFVYLLVLAALGYFKGEAPGGLARLMAEARQERRTARHRSQWRQFLFGQTLRQRQRELLTAQFGIALQAMTASLRAGASIPTAIRRAAPDLEKMLAGQPLKPMVHELELVVRDLETGYSLEEALIRFRDRVGLEDVSDFVGAVLLCRVRGGNTAVVLAGIAEIIEEKIAVRQQILTLTAGKRMEGNLITFAPPILVAVLAFTSPGYLTPLFTSLPGLLMLVAGVVCLTAAWLIRRSVMNIEI